ncbi:MAG: hypothetical protein R3336_00725 [Phycisphaeraceae bacterium]|nr:hypothetical protein [Phycisphaeraceae bacterium]
MLTAQRLIDHPIITPDIDDRPDDRSIGTNINGPSLIRVPDWIDEPLGRYYLYFAHHQGDHIRLAFADELTGPWTLHPPGVLSLADTPFPKHIASPDVHVNHDDQQIEMIYHGCCIPDTPYEQEACYAHSADGLSFTSHEDFLAESYLRAIRIPDGWTGIAKGGRLYRARNLAGPWEPRGWCIDFSGRHFAGWCEDQTLHVIYSRWGDAPERLLHATMDVSQPFDQWHLVDRHDLLAPEREWEGVSEPVRVSHPGSIHHKAHELRDPAVYEEDGRRYVLYSVAGEAGIGIAELKEE